MKTLINEMETSLSHILIIEKTRLLSEKIADILSRDGGKRTMVSQIDLKSIGPEISNHVCPDIVISCFHPSPVLKRTIDKIKKSNPNARVFMHAEEIISEHMNAALASKADFVVETCSLCNSVLEYINSSKAEDGKKNGTNATKKDSAVFAFIEGARDVETLKCAFKKAGLKLRAFTDANSIFLGVMKSAEKPKCIVIDCGTEETYRDNVVHNIGSLDMDIPIILFPSDKKESGKSAGADAPEHIEHLFSDKKVVEAVLMSGQHTN